MSGDNAFFVDANLLLYFVDPVDNQKRVRAAEWLDALWANGAGRLSWQVLNEFYWNAVKKMRLQSAKAREIVEDLSLWSPVGASPGVVHDIGTPLSWPPPDGWAPATYFPKTFRRAAVTTM